MCFSWICRMFSLLVYFCGPSVKSPTQYTAEQILQTRHLVSNIFFWRRTENFKLKNVGVGYIRER